MREIKYQAWLNKQQRMIDVETIKFIDIGGKTHAEVTAKVDHEKGGWYTEIRESTHRKTVVPGSDKQVPRVILRQYTGLKDKNGVEIYEGDIIEITSGYLDAPIISKVTWGGEEYPAFDLPEYDGYGANAFAAIYFSDDDEMKVIGNIYENPELLEGAI